MYKEIDCFFFKKVSVKGTGLEVAGEACRPGRRCVPRI